MSLVFRRLRVLKNIECAQKWFELELSLEGLDISHPLPGQFVSFGFRSLSYRRPFAVSAFKAQHSCSVLYQVVDDKTSPRTQHANATTQMSALKKDDLLDTLMFHGNSFPLPSASHTPVLVGGGIGVGPLLYFAHSLIHTHAICPTMVIGARYSDLIPTSVIEREKIATTICTDDGSMGRRGTVIQALEEVTEHIDNPVVYLCGPNMMMYKGTVLCREKNIPAYVSLDCLMACANGVCVGCVIPIVDKLTTGNSQNISWKKSCVTGPVYDANEVAWEEMISHG